MYTGCYTRHQEDPEMETPAHQWFSEQTEICTYHGTGQTQGLEAQTKRNKRSKVGGESGTVMEVMSLAWTSKTRKSWQGRNRANDIPKEGQKFWNGKAWDMHDQQWGVTSGWHLENEQWGWKSDLKPDFQQPHGGLQDSVCLQWARGRWGSGHKMLKSKQNSPRVLWWVNVWPSQDLNADLYWHRQSS